MTTKKYDNSILIKDNSGNALDFLEMFTSKYSDFSNENIILDLSLDEKINLADIKKYKSLSLSHRKKHKSFVIVASNIDFNEVPDYLFVVPTIVEALDIIGMEEIERDLFLN